MATKRQQNWLGQQRIDVSDLRSIESGVTNDFDILSGKIMSGRQPLVMRGLTISTSTASGNPADSLQLSVAGALMMHFGASESGTIFAVDDNQPAEVLSATNAKVSGSFTAGSTNYIGLDLRRSADSTTTDLKQFLDADTTKEIPKSVPLARTLQYDILISTIPFGVSTNILPIAKVVTDSSNLVQSITDARPMLFRLAVASDNPNPFSSYAWRDASRREGSVTFNPPNSSTDPFVGGDKGILSLKEWMDAMMSVMWEAKSGEYWYSPTARDNAKMMFGSPVFVATGDNFIWTGGSSILQWQSLSIAFENSTGYYNVIQDGSAVIASDGMCLYVDLQRQTNAAVIVPAVGTLETLGTPNIPGSRYIIAWRQAGLMHIRDKAYEVGRNFPIATTTTTGDVKLSQTATTPSTPIVISDGGGTITPPSVSTTPGLVGLTITGGTSTNSGGTAGIGIVSTGGTDTTGSSGGGTGGSFIGGVGSSVGGMGLGLLASGQAGTVSGQGGGNAAIFSGGAGSSSGGGTGGWGLIAFGGNAQSGNTAGGIGLSGFGGNAFGTGVGAAGTEGTGGTPGSSNLGGAGILGQGTGHGAGGIFAGGGASASNSIDQTSAGIRATGGTNGHGAIFLGGVSAHGIFTTGGTGAGNGIRAIGGASGGYGGYFAGPAGGGGYGLVVDGSVDLSGDAAGMRVISYGTQGSAITGGATAFQALSVTSGGSSTNNQYDGILVTGAGIGSGVNATGGSWASGGGAGVTGNGGNLSPGIIGNGGTGGDGGLFHGNGAGRGITAIGGGSSGSGIVAGGGLTGIGVVGIGGSTSGLGGKFTGTNSSADVVQVDGMINLHGSGVITSTGSGGGGGGRVTRSNIVQAWITGTISSAAFTTDDSFNCSSGSVGTNSIIINLGVNMADTKYAIHITVSGGFAPSWSSITKSTTSVTLTSTWSAVTTSGTFLTTDWSTQTVKLNVMIVGTDG